jgi:hypothetical protein
MRDDLDSPGSMLGALVDSFDQSQRGILPQRPGQPEALPNPIGLFKTGPSGLQYVEGRLARMLQNALEVALPFYVEPAMTPVVTAAAESFPEEPLMPQDLPATHGFLLLPHGLMSIDVRGKLLVHNALLWAVRAGGVDMWWLTNKFDDRDMINMEMRAEMGKRWADMPLLSLAQYGRIEFGGPVPMTIGAKKVLPPEISSQVRVIQDPKSRAISWAWPEGYDMGEWMSEAMSLVPDAGTMWVITLWRLMQQTLTDVGEEPVDRPLRKHAQRRNMKQNMVVVIKLRRKKGREGDGTFEYSHRFWRRGHWRQQWYGSGLERYQRAIYIHSTLVNADREDLPILVRDHVYSLSR